MKGGLHLNSGMLLYNKQRPKNKLQSYLWMSILWTGQYIADRRDPSKVYFKGNTCNEPWTLAKEFIISQTDNENTNMASITTVTRIIQ